MTYETRHTDVQRMFGSIAERYDAANTVLSLGIHHLWRRSLLRLLPTEPSSSDRGASLVLDVCTGTGDLLPLIKNRFGSVVGVDFCLPMLQAGKQKLSQPYAMVQGDGLKLPFADGSFDVVTVAFGVRNFERLQQGIIELRRVLKPTGHLLVLEFGQPNNRVFGALFRLYANYWMPFIGGLLTGNREAYAYLPRTAARFPCGDEFVTILQSGGFKDARCLPLTMGVAYAYCAQAAAQP